MNYIFKKAGMSLLSGAACMLGSWLTKEMLEITKKGIVNISKEEKKTKENEESGPV